MPLKRTNNNKEARSVEDRIAVVLEYARSMQAELPKTRDKMREKFPDKDIAWTWIDPTIALCERLEELALAQDTTPEEAFSFAEESLKYLRSKEVKGIFVPDHAEQLAQAIKDRNIEKQ